MYKKSYFWPLVALCVVSLFLFLGQTFFNTRGEPREAVVALSMLQQGNWVLPVNNGVCFPQTSLLGYFRKNACC